MARRKFEIRSDGNGGSSLPNTKPATLIKWIIGGSFITILLFILGISYAAGSKANTIKRNTSDIKNLEINFSKLEDDKDTLTISIAVIGNNVKWIKEQMEADNGR